MLTRATFLNFKNLRDLSVDLGPFTVLVGPNGSGKTSVLQGLELLCRLRERHEGETRVAGHRPAKIFDAVGGAARLRTNGINDPILLCVRTPTSVVELRVNLKTPEVADDADSFGVTVDGVPGPAKNTKSMTEFLNGRVGATLPSAVRLSLDARVLAQPSEVSSANPTLGPSGEGLPSVLSFMAGAHRERLEAIEADLANVVPGVRRIRTYPVVTTVYKPVKHEIDGVEVTVPTRKDVPGHRLALDLAGRGTVDADLLSEGTLLALGLLSALHHPSAPQLFLLDDLDRALHLGAQVRLVRTMTTFLKIHPDVQIVGTTHSPFILQDVASSAVRVMSVAPDGYARCRPLTDLRDFAKWRAVLNTGELWATFGEDWINADLGEGSVHADG